jgi:hypothetical protein
MNIEIKKFSKNNQELSSDLSGTFFLLEVEGEY